jgi:SAM-dependent methyltransferase
MSNVLKSACATVFARNRTVILACNVSLDSPMETRRTDPTRALHDGEGTLWGEGVCTVCAATDFLDFFVLRGIPAQDGVLWSTHEEALNAPRGDISLSLCLNCGYVGNRLFQPDLLRFVGYNVSLEYSPLYQKFIGTLASRLVERYDLREKTILEVGCGNGFFLKTICTLGRNKGIGFDPSYVDVGGSGVNAPEILFIKDFYSERYAQHHGNLVCCRQVIDHLASPKAFLRMIRRLMGERGNSVAYFEVPNPERRFQLLVPWNVGYEHGSWFFPESFRSLVELSGFDVREISPCHDRDYLGIEAVPAPNCDLKGRNAFRVEIRQLADELKTLSDRFRETVSVWEERLRKIRSDHTRAIPWGAGERGIGFLNILNIRELMPFAVDINPERVGKYLPGTGQKVVPPEFLIDYKPELIVITNPTYQFEIQEQATRLGLTCDFLVL